MIMQALSIKEQEHKKNELSNTLYGHVSSYWICFPGALRCKILCCDVFYLFWFCVATLLVKEFLSLVFKLETYIVLKCKSL